MSGEVGARWRIFGIFPLELVETFQCRVKGQAVGKVQAIQWQQGFLDFRARQAQRIEIKVVGSVNATLNKQRFTPVDDLLTQTHVQGLLEQIETPPDIGIQHTSTLTRIALCITVEIVTDTVVGIIGVCGITGKPVTRHEGARFHQSATIMTAAHDLLIVERGGTDEHAVTPLPVQFHLRGDLVDQRRQTSVKVVVGIVLVDLGAITFQGHVNHVFVGRQHPVLPFCAEQRTDGQGSIQSTGPVRVIELKLNCRGRK